MGKSAALKKVEEEPLAKAPRSLGVAAKGVKTSKDFANLMSTLMSDLIEGRVTPNVGNATCNAGGKLLKVIELEYKYGVKGENMSNKTLILAVGDGSPEEVTA